MAAGWVFWLLIRVAGGGEFKSVTDRAIQLWLCCSPSSLHSSVSGKLMQNSSRAQETPFSLAALPQVGCALRRPLPSSASRSTIGPSGIRSWFPSLSSPCLQTGISCEVESCCSPEPSTASPIWSVWHEERPGMMLRLTARSDSRCFRRKSPQDCFVAAAVTQCCLLIDTKILQDIKLCSSSPLFQGLVRCTVKTF